jgi:2-isopropylmalate synthase
VAYLRSDEDLVHDWNAPPGDGGVARPPVALHDETLRDGVQNPSVVDPPIADKLEVVHLLDAVGVYSADMGLPAAGPRAHGDALRLCREVAEQGLRIRPACAGRTLEGDLRPIVEVSQRAGIAVEAMTFIGSSPVRQLVEGWSLDTVRQRSAEAVRFAVRHGLPTTYVTEDTTRSQPEVLAELFRAAVGEGATRICLCDTVGHATPDGVRRLVHFAKGIIAETGAAVCLDWHGHNDRGLALANALVALEAGADRLHGCVLGIGERVGNAPLDQLLINLSLMGHAGPEGADPSKLSALCRKVSDATRFPIPDNYPVMGGDAYRTGSGIHAAAIMKAQDDGDGRLADRVYSAVPATMFGRRQEICVGPMSGASNVVHWLRTRGYTPEPGLVAQVLSHAKRSDHLLSDVELHHLVARHRHRATG